MTWFLITLYFRYVDCRLFINRCMRIRLLTHILRPTCIYICICAEPAPSHYLKHYWLIVYPTLETHDIWVKYQYFIWINIFENIICITIDVLGIVRRKLTIRYREFVHTYWKSCTGLFRVSLKSPVFSHFWWGIREKAFIDFSWRYIRQV